MINDEIKEILDSIKTSSEMSKDTNCFIYRNDYIQKLLDYITNLQQENERLKLEKDTKSASEIICENLHDVYKARCQNAVEYIRYCSGGNFSELHFEPIQMATLLDILNESDE